MPIQTRYDSERRRATFVCAGDIRYEEVLALQQRLGTDTHFQETRQVLVDLRHGRFRCAPEQMALLCKNAPRLLEERRLAWVTNPGQITGLLWFYLTGLGILGSSRICNTLEDATAWLDLHHRQVA
jgi:hypothetical protein